jgi:threonine dehydrogenase-like Zn-dependent dehydrogenase
VGTDVAPKRVQAPGVGPAVKYGRAAKHDRAPTQMDHWYLTAPRTIALVREPVPEPGPGQARVRIAQTVISPGSNLYVYRTGSYSGEGRSVNEELLYMGSGTVDAVGVGVEGVAVGDRVVLSTGHQAYTVAPIEDLHRVPAGLSLRQAAISYLCSWSVSALHIGSYRAAETVVVVGQGLVGSSAALVADLMGARVLALDVDPRRVALAGRLGLGAVEQPGSPAADERIGAFLGPNGVDLILETTGSWHGLRQAIILARDFTRIAVMGIYREPPPRELGLELFGLLNSFPSKFHYQRLQIIGLGSDPDVVAAPAPHLATRRVNSSYVLEQAARGRLRLDRLITHTMAPDEIGAAFERLAGGDTSMVGVVFDWPGGGD